jgi:hypothetical protein
MSSVNNGYKEVNKQPRENGRFTPKDKTPMINLTLRLPVSVIEWIEAEAREKGLSKTDVARELIQKQMPV